jgi:Endonuclease NucS C-terminal domain
MQSLNEKPVRLLLRDMAADMKLGPDSVLTREQAVTWFKEHYPNIKEATVAAHLIRLSTNTPTRLHYNPRADGSDDFFFKLDSRHFRLYHPGKDPLPLTEFNPQPLDSETDGAGEDESSEFAYEHDLRDFLAKNLHLIEQGLRVYQDEGVSGVEFPAGGRFIDILALDKSENYVVIELKVSRGYDRTVGQILRYMAWIAKNQADPGQSVRGVIVAKEITEDLRLACSQVSGVQLFEYTLSVSLKPVEPVWN